MDILPSISSWIIGAASSLRGVSGSPHLDAELILGLVTKRSREKLLTGGNDRLSFFQLIRANYY
ncbi:hypothetical protein FWH09_02590, partial [Candidatus Saccharibacteria bacterium]|nr:hypothetical protein [Candidatus Saccharibacteria bacterium]